MLAFGVKKAKFDFFLITQLHARRLDWRQIGIRSGDSFAGNAWFRDCGVLGERASTVVC